MLDVALIIIIFGLGAIFISVPHFDPQNTRRQTFGVGYARFLVFTHF